MYIRCSCLVLEHMSFASMLVLESGTEATGALKLVQLQTCGVLQCYQPCWRLSGLGCCFTPCSSSSLRASELGGQSGKLFRFVSCVRARGAYVRSDLGENPWSSAFPFPFWPREVFPFPSALQGPIQLQLALSVMIWSLLFQ